jgi:outer membrane protein assembly factor BamB
MVYALQKSNSKPVWKFELDRGVPTQLVVTPQYVIVGSSFQYLYVIDKMTGKGVYRFNVGYDSGFSGSPAFDAASGRLYLLSGSGNLYAFQLRKPRAKNHPRGQTDPYVF